MGQRVETKLFKPDFGDCLPMARVPALRQRMLMLTDYETCSGCQSCVMACSLTKMKVFSPSKSLITLSKVEDRCLGVPVVCEHCDDPPCQAACPVSAITKDHNTGVVNISQELCTGCKACGEACPFGAGTIKFWDGRAIICDLCDGDPACVRTCTQKALMFLPATRATVARIAELARRRRSILASIGGV